MHAQFSYWCSERKRPDEWGTTRLQSMPVARKRSRRKGRRREIARGIEEEPGNRRRAAGIGRDRRRAIRYSYPGQGNRSLLGKTRVAVEGPFHFPRGCRRRRLSGGREPRERIEGRRWRENSPFCALDWGTRGEERRREQFFFIFCAIGIHAVISAVSIVTFFFFN